MDVASYYPTVPNECFIQRTTATFIRKSYLTIPLRHCRRPLYAYINRCGSVLNRLFYQQPISICMRDTIKTVCILLSIACTVNFLELMIPDSWFQLVIRLSSEFCRDVKHVMANTSLLNQITFCVFALDTINIACRPRDVCCRNA